MEYPLIILLSFTMSSKEADFEKFVRTQNEAYVDWHEQNPGDQKAYLDSKVLEFSKPKDIPTLKKQVYLLAMYHVKKEVPSEIIQASSRKYDDLLRGVDMSKLKWEDLLDKIKSLDKAKQTKPKDYEREVTSEPILVKSSGG